MAAQPGLYWTLLETPKTGFLTTGLILNINLAALRENLSSGFPTRSDTNLALWPQMIRGLKMNFIIIVIENKGADQLCGIHAAALHPCFSHMQKGGFLMTRLN